MGLDQQKRQPVPGLYANGVAVWPLGHWNVAEQQSELLPVWIVVPQK
jgi:hypothetical protein